MFTDNYQAPEREVIGPREQRPRPRTRQAGAKAAEMIESYEDLE